MTNFDAELDRAMKRLEEAINNPEERDPPTELEKKEAAWKRRNDNLHAAMGATDICHPEEVEQHQMNARHWEKMPDPDEEEWRRDRRRGTGKRVFSMSWKKD